MKETEIGISKKENHAVLSDIEKKLSLLIINTVESFVLVDTDFRIINFNTAYERQFAKLFKRQIKKGDSIINFSEVRSQLESIEIYNKVFKGETINSEVKLTYPDNTIHTYSVLYKPALDDSGNIFGAFVTTYDITEQSEAISKIKQSKYIAEAIFEHTSESFVLLDTNCIITGYNNKMMQFAFLLLGNKIEIGESFLEFVDKSRHEFFIGAIAKVLKGATIQFDRSFKKKNASTLWINLRLTPITYEGEITGIAIAVSNITQRLQNKAAQIQLYDKLKRKAEALSQSNEELEQFAYIASHDLQEPLRMIRSFMSLLESNYKEQLDDKAKEYIHFAEDGAAHMQKIIFDLLEYSTIGRKEYQYEEVDMNILMDEVLQLNKSTINDKNAKVTVDKLPTIYGFKSPLLQLFLNLLANALNYQLPHVQPLITVTSEEHIDYW